MAKRSVFQLFSISLVVAFLAGCTGTNSGPLKVPERFFLAYAQQDGSIRVSYSNNGTNWQNGNFQSSAVNEPIRGVGAAADKEGVLHIIMVDEPDNEINLVWGFGPEVWDNQGKSEPLSQLASPPSVVSIGENKYLVVYRRNNGVVAANVYDHAERQFTVDVAPQHSRNSNVKGRPAITNMNGKLLLAWRNNINQLFTSFGEFSNGTPVFSTPIEVPLPEDTDNRLLAGLANDPDVTHDHNQFYLVTIRQRTGDLNRFEAHILNSLDGINWGLQGTTLIADVNLNTAVNIAGKSDGTLLLAAVKLSTGEIVASKFRNGQWNALNDQQIQAMFGSTRAAKMQFTLIGTGQP